MRKRDPTRLLKFAEIWNSSGESRDVLIRHNEIVVSDDSNDDKNVIVGVPIIPGIPLAKVVSIVPWLGMILWLAVLITMIFVGLRFLDRYTVDERVELSSGISVNVNLKNCLLRVRGSNELNENFVILKSWSLLMEHTDIHRQLVLPESHTNSSRIDKPTYKRNYLHNWKKIFPFAHWWDQINADNTEKGIKKFWKDHFATNRERWADAVKNAWMDETESVVKPFSWSDNKTLNIDIRISKQRPFFQCLVEFNVQPEFLFENFNVSFLPVDNYVNVLGEVPIKANRSITIEALHATISLNSLEAKQTRLSVRDGSIKFALDGPKESYDFIREDALTVQSRTAPVTVESSIPLDVTMDYEVASRSLFRGYGLREAKKLDSMITLVVYSKHHEYEQSSFISRFEHNSLSITMQQSQAPLYVTAREKENFGYMPTWAGVEQIEKPHLLKYSETLIKQIYPWIMWQPAAPWVVLITQLGEYLPKGIWRVVSSNAYLSGNNWFVLFSAGLLQPRSFRISVHVTGVYCRSPQNRLPYQEMADFFTSYGELGQKQGALLAKAKEIESQGSDETHEDDSDSDDDNDNEFFNTVDDKTKFSDIYPGTFIQETPHVQTCIDEVQDQIFVVLWKALKKARKSGALTLWSERDTGKETRYELISDTVIKDDVNWTDCWLFSIAIIINVVASLISGGFLTMNYVDWQYRFFREDMEEISALKNASYRLNHCVVDLPPSQWNVNVMNHPPEGFTLKWNYVIPSSAVTIAVYVVSEKIYSKSERAIKKQKRDEELASLLDHDNLVKSSITTEGEIVIYLPLSAVKSSRVLGVSQRELFIPLKHPGVVVYSSVQRYELSSFLKYRFKCVALGNAGRELASTPWTQEIRATSRLSTTDLPLIAIRRAFPPSGGSLQLFVHKHCSLSSSFQSHKILSDFKLEIFDESADASDIRNIDLIRNPQQVAESVNLKLKIYFGSNPDEARRATLQKGRKIYHEILFQGRPSLSQIEGTQCIYVISAIDGSMKHIVRDRIAMGDTMRIEVLDNDTGHQVAAGMLNHLMVKKAGLEQQGTSSADSELGFCWKPQLKVPLTRGKKSAISWGRLILSVNAVTQRDLCRHNRNEQDSLTFIDDQPGTTYAVGTEVMILWKWNETNKPAYVWLHVHDHTTGERLESLAETKAIPNTGSYCWAVEIEMLPGLNARLCYFTLTEQLDGPTIAQSNAFFGISVMPLCTFELAYASFCKTHGLDMEHVSVENLNLLDIDCATYALKICPNLRHPLPYESKAMPLIHSSGQCIIATTSKILELHDPLSEIETQHNRSIQVYKSISSRIWFLENCSMDENDSYWWSESSDIFFIQNGLLDVKVFLFVDQLFSLLQLQKLWNNFQDLVADTYVKVFGIQSHPNHQRRFTVQTTGLFPMLMPPDPISKLRRFIEYQIIPIGIHIAVSLYQIWWFCSWPVSMVCLYGIYNYLVQEFQKEPHWETSAKYLSDIVFDRSLRFVGHLPFPGPWLLGFTTYWILHMTVAIFFNPLIRNQSGKWFQLVETLCVVLETCHVFIVYSLGTMFVLWFFLGALINSDALLPYAVMGGCIAFIAYTLWCDFAQAKEIVLAYIEENQQTLLSILFDKWFAHHKLTFDIRSVITNDSGNNKLLIVNAERQIREELRNLKYQKLRCFHKQVIRNPKLDVQYDYTTDDALSVRSQATPLREQLRYWVYDKIQLSHTITQNGGSFWFDENLQACGLDLVSYLPADARFASLKEVNDDINKVDDLLVGFDAAILLDGVKYGPRFGFKGQPVNEKLATGRYDTAIVAYSRYPAAYELETTTKVALILEYFDENCDDILDESETQKWINSCNKVSFQHGNNQFSLSVSSSSASEDSSESKGAVTIVENYLRERRQNMFGKQRTTTTSSTTSDLEARGLGLQHLLEYYASVDELNEDYTNLFPTLEMTETETAELQAFRENKVEEIHEEGMLAQEQIWDQEYDQDDSDDDDEEQEYDSYEEEQIKQDVNLEGKEKNTKEGLQEQTATTNLERILEERVRENLKTNLNALKLQYIFQHLMKRSRGTQIDNLTKSFPFVAQQIFEVQWALLSPIFGEDLLVAGRKAQSSRLTHSLTLTLKLLHLDIIREFEDEFHAMHNRIFKSITLRIAEFYDHQMAAKVQLKSSRLSSARLEILKSELHPSSRWALDCKDPVYAYQAYRKYADFRSKKTIRIRDWLTTASLGGQYQSELQMSLVTYILKEIGLLGNAEITRRTNTIRLETGVVKKLEFYSPKSTQGVQFLQKLIFQNISQGGFTAETLSQIVYSLLSDYMWFSEFRFLIDILGIDLKKDELPGRIWFEESELHEKTIISDFQEILKRQYMLTSSHPLSNLMNRKTDDSEVLREKRNLFKMHRVFQQLSGNSYFLPVDLADEGVLLLTDNAMSLSCVVAALRYLEIGPWNIAGRTKLSQELEKVGIKPGTPVTVLEPAMGTTMTNSDMLEEQDDEYLNLLEQQLSDTDKFDADSLSDLFDWTNFVGPTQKWPRNIIADFQTLTTATPGFMGRSQMVEFVKAVERSIMRLSAAGDKDQSEALISFKMFHQVVYKQGYTCSRQHSRILWLLICSEMAPLIEKYGGLWIGEVWSQEGLDNCVVEVLPLRIVSSALARIILQPSDSSDKLITFRNDFSQRKRQWTHKASNNLKMMIHESEVPLTSVSKYEGCLNFLLFKKLMGKLSIDLDDKGLRKFWNELEKHLFEITQFLPYAEDLTKRKDGTKVRGFISKEKEMQYIGNTYLRVAMDPLGLDPTMGSYIKIARLKLLVPKILMTGLWPEAARVLFRLYLQLESFEDSRFDRLLEKNKGIFNRYGLIKMGTIPILLTNMNFEGMSFPMLREMVDDMKLALPDRNIKQMFDLMDVNHDHSLDLVELLSGFDILISRVLPEIMLTRVGLTPGALLLQLSKAIGGLVVFFLFTAFSFISFVAVSNGASTAVQSLLALLGAVGLQTGASQDVTKVAEHMRRRLEQVIAAGTEKSVVGTGKLLEKKLAQNKEDKELVAEKIQFETSLHVKHKTIKPVKVRYNVPKKFMPSDSSDPWPCVTFRTGDAVRLEPVVDLSCGATVYCPATSIPADEPASDFIDETYERILQLGPSGSLRSKDVMIDWVMIPSLPPGVGLEFDNKTGVISGVIPEVNEEWLSKLESTSSSQPKYTALRNSKMKKRCFQIICRNVGGSARTRLTFQIVPKINSGEV